MKKSSWYTALVPALVLVSCVSAQKRAGELMEKGDFEGAAASYEKIVERDPNNAEARAGLNVARAKILDRRLIEIRKTREAGQGMDAANQLLAIYDLENRWNMKPPGAAVYTQQEEAGFATGAVLATLTHSVNGEFPLKTELELRRFKPLFQESRANEFKALLTKNRADGKIQCRKLAKQVKSETPYAADFIGHYCTFWGVDDAVTPSSAAIQKTLLREMNLTPSLTGFPTGAAGELSLRLNDALHATPWFSAEGALAPALFVSGSWSQDIQKNTTQLSHAYKVKERYIEYVDVPKTRDIPYEVIDQVMNATTGRMEPKSRIAHRTENYSVKEPRERTRDIQNTYLYGGWNVVQNLKVNLEGTTTLGGRAIQFSVNDQSHAEDTASDIVNAEVGLQKKAPTLLPDPTQWLRARQDQLGAQLKAKLTTAWFDLYCSDAVVESFASAGNRARQCLRLSTAAAQPPKFVEDWHRKYFALGTRQIDEIFRSKAR